MTTGEYKRAGDLFDRICGLPESERQSALERACGGDEDLRNQVMRLLKADRAARVEEFLARPVLEEAAEMIAPESARMPASGMVFGNYRLGKRIGSGGMGIVYEAEDLDLGRRVAVKILPVASGGRSPAQAEERIQRFQREARAAGRLNHPHIAAVYGAGRASVEAGGFHYIAMEFVEGRTLREIITDGTRDLDPKMVLEVVSQTASALSAAHTAGIVHRDVKPENIMVRPDGFVKVLDFGLALMRESPRGAETDLRTRPGNLAGTVQYLSPEQVLGKPAGPQSDLFSLGVVAYELATGVRPFDGASDGAIYDAILHAEPARPSTIRPSLGTGLDDVIQHALEKDPELRYQTAGDFRSSCLRLTRISTPSNGVAGPAVRNGIRKVERRARRFVLFGSLGLLLAGGAGAAWWMLGTATLPHVAQVVQITRSRSPVYYYVYDGARLYFAAGTADSNMRMFEVDTAGGEPLPLPQFDGFIPMDVSPNHAQILLAKPMDRLHYGTLSLWVAPTTGSAPRRLGDLEGHFARWSPKGDRILVSQQGSLMNAASNGFERHEIANVNGYIEEAAWSSDGERIRFTVSLPNSRRIWQVRPDGADLHVVSFRGWSQPWEEMGQWTADGRYYLFSAGQAAHDLWIVRDSRFGTPFRLTNGPLWSLRPELTADGHRVYFVGSSSIGQLVRFDGKAGEWLPMLGGMDATQIEYSRDGKWIAYADSKGCLWRGATNGLQRLQLTDPPLFARNPRWSPDGQNIVFYAGPVGEPDSIYMAAASGGSLVRLTHGEQGRGEADGSFSPDGLEILYEGYSRDADRKRYLYVIDVRSRAMRQLPNTARLWSPRWSPDGKYLVCLDENTRLRLYDMATHQSARLTSFPAGYPGWARDGRSVYFENDSSTKWYRVSIATKKVELLQTLPAMEAALNSSGWVSTTPDGTVISTKTLNTSNLYALELEGK